MAKVILILLAFALSMANAQKIITADFKDARFLAEVRKKIQKSGNKPIYDNDVADIVFFDNLYGKKITSLAGIEHFKNLVSLTCYDNLLTSLDVSKNKALEILNVRSNQLTLLDISKNEALSELYAHKNKLIKIDVSKNTNLSILNVSENQLTSFDIYKNNEVLRELNVGSNQLTSLDLSKYKNLQGLGAANNFLTSLDVSKNTNLTFLDISGNQLTSLDVSKNTNLTFLDISGNQLTSLDVSKNEFSRLDCSKNLMPSKAAVKCFKGKCGDDFTFDPQRKKVLNPPKDLK